MSSTPDRRRLHFTDLDQILIDVRALATAEREGKLRTSGKWTLGQSLNNLSSWIDYCFDGLPFKPPLIVRLIARPFKNRMLYKPMRAGSNIPGVKGGTLATEPMSLDDGLAQMEKAIARLKGSTPQLPHAIFGKMTREERLNLHYRHCELHLSFFSVG